MKKKHFGGNFEDFLKGEGLLETCRARAIKFKRVRELGQAMSPQKISLCNRNKPVR